MNTHLPIPQSLLHGEPSLEALHREAYHASRSEQTKKTAPPAEHPSMADSAALIRARATAVAGGYFA